MTPDPTFARGLAIGVSPPPAAQEETDVEVAKVRYTVRPEFVEQNKANIRRVMDALKTKPIPGIKYASFTADDGRTFIHINIMKSDEAKAKFLAMPEFKEFQDALKDSKPEDPPSAEGLELVAAGYEI